MKKKKKKALKRLADKSWRHAWAKRLDDMASLDGLAESLKVDGNIKIDRAPAAWWKNHAS